MAMEGVDYAWDRPSVSGLYSVGKRFVGRYISYDRTGKNMTKNEANSIRGHGMDVVVNWEATTDGARGGHAEGVRHGRDALAQAHALGVPPGAAIYFSIDFDAQPHEMPTVMAYFGGVASQVGHARTGAYGGYNQLAYLHNFNAVAWYWQTYAWSGGRVLPYAHLLQYHNHIRVAGGIVDLDRALKPSFGAWSSGPTQPGPIRETPPTETLETGWDYSNDIAGTSERMASLAHSLSNYATIVDNIRNL